LAPLLLGLPRPCLATTIDFEGFSDSTFLTNQISGLTFSNALVLTAGISLNELEFPPHSGSNVVSDNSGPITILFNAPENQVAGYFTYASALTLQAFDASNNLLSTATSLFGSNFVSSGHSPNEFLSLSGAGITKVTITGDPGGLSFVLDDLSFTGSAATPVPAALPLFASGLGVMGLLARRRLRKVAADTASA
jgi:hypothetical protein